MKNIYGLFLVAVLLRATPLCASEAYSVRSVYLGDGWFQYDVTMYEDPFFQEASLEGVGLIFGNFTDLGESPTNWTSGIYQGQVGWNYSTIAPAQVRPYSISFFAHSSNTTFKTGKLVVVGSLVANNNLYSTNYSNYEVYSPNMVFFTKLKALGPCLPEEADGSATSIYDSMEMIPDLRIDQIEMISNLPYGLTFSWETPCTVQIQASTNLTSWTAITNVLGNPPSTTWTSPAPLWTYGNYFKLRLMATEHRPDLMIGE